MTATVADTGRRERGWRLAALSIGQVVSWGVLYYGLLVSSTTIAVETGWPLAAITACFSGGLVASALAGMVVGKLLDDVGPRIVMTAGSVVGVAGFVVVAVAPNIPVFALGWIICGVGQAAVLYQASFTVITRRYGARRQGALTILTLAGGLASTIFAPINAALLTVLDWRATFLVLAAVVAVVTIPLHAVSLERSWPERPPPHPDEDVHTVTTVLRSRRFWFLEITSIALMTSIYCVTLNAIPLFTEKGFSFELAAVVLGLLGAGQVVGRLMFLLIPRGAQPWMPMMLVGVLMTALLVLLAVVPGPPWLVILVGVVAGAVRGALTLINANAVSDRWGTRNYGSINGVYSAGTTIVGALTPAIGAVIAAGTGSFAAMALIMAGVAALAALLARGT
jgi:MFS family permease